jgi:nitrate/nitrite transport system permease protein
LDPEYAALVGQAAATGGQTPFPRPSEIGARLWELLRDPFYVRGTNDQGIGVQIAYSLLRVGAGFGIAALVAIPLGFLICMSPLLSGALNPFIQVLRPVSPARLDAARALHRSRTARSPPSSSSSSARCGRCC